MNKEIKNELAWFAGIISAIFALGIGLPAGFMIEKGLADAKIVDLQAQVETANASLADLAAQYRQSEQRMIAWTGLASFYAEKHHGKIQANGKCFDMNAMTAAHRTLPFGSLVLVLDMKRSTWTLVEVTDRGPAQWTGREIDLSRAAARQLGMEKDGVVPALMISVQGRPSTGD